MDFRCKILQELEDIKSSAELRKSVQVFQVTMVVVFSKEKPVHCGNCKARLETSCFRCLQCGEIVSCPKCNPRESREDRAPPSRPFDHPSCPRGGFASRGRGFDAPHFACLRGGFSPRGSFDSGHRLNFSTTVPFPGSNRGSGFGPRGFGGFPPRGPHPASFRPMLGQGGIEDFSEMHGRSFGPFPPRGGAGFPRGVPGRGMARGRGGFCRGRGGFPPFSGSRGMGCVDCDCNHLRVFPEMVEKNNDGGNGGACNCVAPGMGEENRPDAREGSPTMVEESVHDVKGDDATEPVCLDHEG